MSTIERFPVSRKFVWGTVAVITTIFGYRVTDWDALNRAASADPGNTIAIVRVGLYCFPVTLATMLSILLIRFRVLHGVGAVLGICGLFFGACLFATIIGVGATVDPTAGTRWSGPWLITLPLYIITMYVRAYGFGLFLTAVAIGAGLASEVERLYGEDVKKEADQRGVRRVKRSSDA